MSSTMTDAVSRTTSEQIERANATDRTPVVFVHGLWLLPSSWDRWATLFEEAGYPAVTPGWPDDPETVEEAKAHPETFAHKMVGQVADHFAKVIGRLKKKPVVIGHSFGGLITQMLAGRGLALVSVAIDPAPFRGVLPLPLPSLKSASPLLGNPAHRGRDRLRLSVTCHAIRSPSPSTSSSPGSARMAARPRTGSPLAARRSSASIGSRAATPSAHRAAFRGSSGSPITSIRITCRSS